MDNLSGKAGSSPAGKLKTIFRFLTENQNPTQTVRKNAAWLLGGQMASRLLRAAIVVYAARILGADSWGAFSYALGVATFLTVFSDIGIGALLTREGSRSPDLRDRYLGTAIGAKLILVGAVTLGMVFLFPYLTSIGEAKAIMPILIFVFAFDTLRDLGSAFARALERMEVEAVTQIFTNFAIVALGFILLGNQETSRSLAIAYAAGSGVGLLGIAYALRKHLSLSLKNFDPRLLREIFATAWPFGLFGIMGVVMLNTDIIMLGWMRTPAEVGYYAAAQKLIQLLYVFPTIFASSLFPTLTRLTSNDRAKAKSLLERSVSLAILTSIPVAALGIFLGPWIIGTFFGPGYAPAIPAFQILMATITIIFPSALVGNAIFAYGEQRRFVHLVAVAIFGNIALNAVLIPPFGIGGAAAATVVTQLTTNSLIWIKMKKLNGFSVLPDVKRRLSQFLGFNYW